MNNEQNQLTTNRGADVPVRAGSIDPARANKANPTSSEQSERTTNPDSDSRNRERSERIPDPVSGVRDQRERAPYTGPEVRINGEWVPLASRGPKTPEGKSISSKNALTHGLTAQKPENAVDPALKSQYDALRNEYLKDYKPQGAIESTLLDLIVLSVWQLYKVQQIELFTDLDLGFEGSFGKSEKLSRYRTAHERSLHRNLNQLKQIQQERLFKETDREARLPTQVPPGVRVKPLLQHLKTLEKHPKTKTAAATHNSSRRPAPLHRKTRPFPRS